MQNNNAEKILVITWGMRRCGEHAVNTSKTCPHCKTACTISSTGWLFKDYIYTFNCAHFKGWENDVTYTESPSSDPMDPSTSVKTENYYYPKFEE